MKYFQIIITGGIPEDFIRDHLEGWVALSSLCRGTVLSNEAT